MSTSSKDDTGCEDKSFMSCGSNSNCCEVKDQKESVEQLTKIQKLMEKSMQAHKVNIGNRYRDA